jgi:SAM-dependent methyltransferase
MQRITFPELKTILQCVECTGTLAESSTGLICGTCHREYHSFRGKPVLIRNDNPLFPHSSFTESSNNQPEQGGKGRFHAIKRLVPSKSVNLSRERCLQRLAQEIPGASSHVLVLGCGDQANQLEILDAETACTLVFCDISKSVDLDVFCDAHRLPFKSATFDAVITTAVLEHVLYPDKVVSEMVRVLGDEGLIYSELPFLQSVHEGAYDFTRFSLSGHRRLMEAFSEEDVGLVAGPGTALVWSICDFAKAVIPGKKLSTIGALLARAAFFWLKYFDYLAVQNQHARDSASCTYFYGRKAKSPTTAAEIVSRYGSV